MWHVSSRSGLATLRTAIHLSLVIAALVMLVTYKPSISHLVRDTELKTFGNCQHVNNSQIKFIAVQLLQITLTLGLH